MRGVIVLADKQKKSKKSESVAPKIQAAAEIRHLLVPKHEIISSEELTELLAKMNVKMENLPKIYSGDPAIRHLNAKAGDVIKITRNSQTAGTAIYYRLVIEGGVFAPSAEDTEETAAEEKE